MIAVFIVFAAVALIAAGLTGWLVGVRATRARLTAFDGALVASDQRANMAETRLADWSAREQQLVGELAVAREVAATSREELGGMSAAIAAAHLERGNADLARRATQRALEAAQTELGTARAELAKLQERLAATESGSARERRAVAEVQRVLAPLMERERLAGQLARLEVGRGTRGELPRMMDAIAEVGSFSTVVLSDEAGLPLAMNEQSTDGETLAGVWSMLLTVADRIAASGAPVPVAVVVHDAANQTILHRLFSSAGSRFLLTAVGRTRSLEPEALDPALGKLERMLAGSVAIAS